MLLFEFQILNIYVVKNSHGCKHKEKKFQLFLLLTSLTIGKLCKKSTFI